MTDDKDPAWLAYARMQIGVRETPGKTHTQKILDWWKAIRRGGIKDDETPWCAAFVGGCLEAVGIRSSSYESAVSYAAWGRGLNAPTYGSIVVLARKGGHHVGFLVGRSATGELAVLGGNQADAVNIKMFSHDRLKAQRWPEGVPVTNRFLPFVDADGSVKES